MSSGPPEELVRALDALIARHGREAVRRALDAAEGGPEPGNAAPPRASFRLRLLGRPEVFRRGPAGDWEPIAWPFERALRALLFLATCPDRQAAKQEIVAALWPDADGADDAGWRRNFHPTLSHLRRCLRGGDDAESAGGSPVVLRRGLYRLSSEAEWWIDADELVRHAGEGAAAFREGRRAEAIAAWESAWKLHRGDLLEGVDTPWAAARRDELERTFVATLHALGAAYEEEGRAAEALDAYRAALTVDPLQERLHAALMRLYGRLGRRDLVRRQYQRLTRLLRDELGVEPLAESTDEYHRLMTGAR